MPTTRRIVHGIECYPHPTVNNIAYEIGHLICGCPTVDIKTDDSPLPYKRCRKCDKFPIWRARTCQKCHNQFIKSFAQPNECASYVLCWTCLLEYDGTSVCRTVDDAQVEAGRAAIDRVLVNPALDYVGRHIYTHTLCRTQYGWYTPDPETLEPRKEAVLNLDFDFDLE